MKPDFKIVLLAAIALAAPTVRAQDEPQEESIELSKFSVSTDYDAGYVSGSASRTRVINSDNSPVPNVPITIVKRAESVAVQFVLRNDQDKADVRNAELFDTLTQLETAAKAAGLVIEQREVRLTGGERKTLSFSRGGTTSFLNIVIIAKLEPDARVADVVKKVRDVVSPKRLVGKTRVADGSVGLVIQNPAQYRRELLSLIFEDIEVVRKGVGKEFEVLMSGLSRPIQLRPVGEGQLELWIDYSFMILSIRGLENPGVRK